MARVVGKKVNKSGNFGNSEEAMLREAFEGMDPDGKGKVPVKDLIEAFTYLGADQQYPEYFSWLQEFEDSDENRRNGGLTFSEFKTMLDKKFDDKKTTDGERKVFNLAVDLDENGDGFIGIDELKKMANEVGLKYTTEELQRMISQYSKDGERITFEEFHEIVTKKN